MPRRVGQRRSPDGVEQLASDTASVHVWVDVQVGQEPGVGNRDRAAVPDHHAGRIGDRHASVTDDVGAVVAIDVAAVQRRINNATDVNHGVQVVQ